MKNRLQLTARPTKLNLIQEPFALIAKRILKYLSPVPQAIKIPVRSRQKIGHHFSHLSDELRWDTVGNLMDDCK